MIQRRAFLHWPLLLAALSFATAGSQEQEARLVMDANHEPGEFRADIGWVMPLGKGAVFPMDTIAHGAELWASDGTPGGTRLLKDVVPGPGGSVPQNPVAFGTGVGAKVAFVSDPGTPANELWVTDGTEAGTVRVFQCPVPGYAGEAAAQAGTPGGAFFESRIWDLEDSFELLFSDGTEAGTWALNPVEGESRARFSMPFGYVTSGSWCYFIANEHEIWRSDGTEAGTTKVLTVTEGWPNQLTLAGSRLFVEVRVDDPICQLWTCRMDGGEPTRLGPPEGIRWYDIQDLIASGDEAFFITEDEDEARHLWASDGTEAGTRRIPVVPRNDGAEPRVLGPLTPWNGAVYASVQREDGRYELWRSHGMAGGTSRLASFSTGVSYLSPREPRATGDFLFFHVERMSGQWDLWRTKGDAASTRPVRGTPTSYPLYTSGPLLAATESGLFFVAGPGTVNEALWLARGKTAGAVRLTRPERSSGSSFVPSPANAAPYEMLGGNLLSFVNTGRGYELWRMNPDGSRSRAIWKPAVPLGQNGLLGFRAVIGATAVFTLSDGAERQQVWATDGTRSGTRLLADYDVATDGAYPQDFVNAGGVWFYSVVNQVDVEKASLWRTDGTPAGTSKVVAADGSVPNPDAWEMVAFQGRLYFLATGADHKTALWRSDGTANGTVRLTDEWQEGAMALSAAGNRLIFFVKWHDSQILWQSDGTPEGTAVVSPVLNFAKWSLSPAVDLGGVAIFQATQAWVPGDLPRQWWRHDATGTRPVRDFVPGEMVWNWHHGSEFHAVAGAQLFYTAIENDDSELWVTDGTSDGTRRVKDLNPGPLGSVPEYMLAVGNLIYFTAWDADHGNELWRSDGTEAGTVLVADIEPGPAGSSPRGLKVMDGKLYFTATRRDVGWELFVIDLPPP